MTKRLGNVSGGISKIKNHDFFKDINWDALAAQDFGPSGIKIPFLPEKVEEQSEK